jgi:hypothetical protein
MVTGWLGAPQQDFRGTMEFCRTSLRVPPEIAEYREIITSKYREKSQIHIERLKNKGLIFVTT